MKNIFVLAVVMVAGCDKSTSIPSVPAVAGASQPARSERRVQLHLGRFGMDIPLPDNDQPGDQKQKTLDRQTGRISHFKVHDGFFNREANKGSGVFTDEDGSSVEFTCTTRAMQQIMPLHSWSRVIIHWRAIDGNHPRGILSHVVIQADQLPDLPQELYHGKIDSFTP